MRKKNIKLLSGIVAAALTCTVAFGGCSLISTDSAKDMKRTVAEVDISKTEAFKSEFKENSEYFDYVGSTSIIKRELITYFVSVGYSYMQSYGWTAEKTFNTLMDGLTSNAVLTQYATMYLLQKKTAEDATALETFRTLSGEGHDESEKYEYLLGGADSDDVKTAKYTLMYTINAAIDSVEKTKIIKDDSTESGSDTRTAPENVDTEREDFYPKKKNQSGEYITADGTVIKDTDAVKNYVLDYGIYTGYTSLGNSGTYAADRDELLAKKSTPATRIRAYTRFVSGLIDYNLVDETKENVKDVYSLVYYQDEYVNQLKAQIINKYYDLYEEEQIEKLMGGDSSYLDDIYNSLFKLQTDSYKTESDFSTAIGNMSDTSFILYAPEAEEGGTFGFVYNILLPYSASQSAKLSELQTMYADEEVDSGYSSKYYENRNRLLKQIKTTDQRRAWFDGSTEYAFKADGKVDNYFGDSGWLFFENNLTDTARYEPLDKYVGKYAYNGNVIKKDDGKYVFGTLKQLSIDDMLKEFTDYVDYVLNGYVKGGASHVTFDANYNASSWENASGYYGVTDFYTGEKNDDKQDQIDYSKLVYASGKVGFTADRANALNPDADNAQYWAMSAVNELQYAYTTDTGVLSQYLGYTVEAGDTSYIKEFEYAAHEAVNKGAGSFTVCAGDYGWHLIYVTYTFDIAAGNDTRALYSPNWKDNITKEGTFEYMFYEWIKDNDMEDISSTRQTQIVNKYKKDDITVTKYEKAYKNLFNIG